MIAASVPTTVTNDNVEIAWCSNPEGSSVVVALPDFPLITLTDTEAQVLSRLTLHLARHCGKVSLTVTSGDVLTLARLPEGVVFGAKDGQEGKVGQCLFSAPESWEFGERLLDETFGHSAN